jgi:hypothetical protein
MTIDDGLLTPPYNDSWADFLLPRDSDIPCQVPLERLLLRLLWSSWGLVTPKLYTRQRTHLNL